MDGWRNRMIVIDADKQLIAKFLKKELDIPSK
jgi:RNA polymerase subunit RPABC4/transcription elongation factor Spt4